MEKVVSVIITTEKTKSDNWSAEDLSNEFDELIRSARLKLEDRIICKLRKPSPAFLLGTGKIEEIKQVAQAREADAVIFSEELSGTQQNKIEEILGIKTIDRTQLILDIFARRARSNEGKIQVELAQLEYLLPRLSGKGILLSRLGGGIGARGPGEQKLEVDRRRIKSRIDKLKSALTTIAKQRVMRRKKRSQFSLLTAAIVGYTNTGKSTLLNILTDSDIIADDKPFSTLDPTIRKYTLPNNQNILFVDTVGFLYRLPHNLIEAFRATLEEAVEADLILHVLDMSHPKLKEQSEATYKVLEELKVKDKPIITVLNKRDKIKDPFLMDRVLKDFEDAVAVSALCNENIGQLIDRITLYLSRLTDLIKINIPINNMKLLNLIYEHGKVRKRVDGESHIYIEAQVPQRVTEKIRNDFSIFLDT